MQKKQEFVLNASRDALISFISSNKEVYDSSASEFADDRLVDSLIYGFSKLYDKCAKLKEEDSGARSHD